MDETIYVVRLGSSMQVCYSSALVIGQCIIRGAINRGHGIYTTLNTHAFSLEAETRLCDFID